MYVAVVPPMAGVLFPSARFGLLDSTSQVYSLDRR